MFKLNFIASGSDGNSCLISDGKTGILVDVGVSVKTLRNKIDLKTISAIFLTHEHQDHSMYAIELANKLQVPLLSGKGTHDIVSEKLYKHLRFNIRAGKAYRIGSLKIKPIIMYHDAVEPLGFLVSNEQNEKIMFCSDTGTMRDLHVKANIYVLEMNYNEDYARKLYDSGKLSDLQYYRLLGEDGHMSVNDSIEFVKYNTPDDATIFFHHLGSNLGDVIPLSELGNREVFTVKRGVEGLLYTSGYIPPEVPF